MAVLWLLLAAGAPARGEAPTPLRVYAAASLSGVMNDVAAAWERLGHPRPLLVLAGSPTLAKQIDAGARADVFIAADTGWMDYLAARGHIDAASRANLAGNALVLIAPASRPFAASLRPGAPLAAAFGGRLCTGETESVPVGLYAREALQSLGLWRPLQSRVVGLDDARAALALVERGECGAGIVYATDAATSTQVVVVAAFPASSHRPIVYPAAVVTGAGPQGAEFLRFLRSGTEARATFERHGFLPPGEAGT